MCTLRFPGRFMVLLAGILSYAKAFTLPSPTLSNAQKDNDSPSYDRPYTVITPTWTVPAEGIGTSYAAACNAELQSHESFLLAGLSTLGEVIPVAKCSESTSYTAPVTVLCDGRTRLLGTLTPVTSGTFWISEKPMDSYTGPAPTCSIQPKDCAWLQVYYLSTSSAWSSSWSVNSYSASDLPPYPPVCAINGEFNKGCGQCTIHGGDVQLLYFPVTTVPTRNMCATAPQRSTLCPFGSTLANNETISGFVTAPCPYIDKDTTSLPNSGPYTVINQTTFYSNRAYISFETLYATNTCGRVGSAYANSAIAVPSANIYSVSGYHFGLSHAAYSFNFDDLIPPIPASAYLCQPNCYDSDGSLGFFEDYDMVNDVGLGRLGFCATIIDQGYRPILAVPPEMRGIDPAWKNCLLGLDGLYDPPLALISQTTVEGVSLPPWATGEPLPGGTPTADSPVLTTPILPASSRNNPPLRQSDALSAISPPTTNSRQSGLVGEPEAESLILTGPDSRSSYDMILSSQQSLGLLAPSSTTLGSVVGDEPAAGPLTFLGSSPRPSYSMILSSQRSVVFQASSSVTLGLTVGDEPAGDSPGLTNSIIPSHNSFISSWKQSEAFSASYATTLETTTDDSPGQGVTSAQMAGPPVPTTHGITSSSLGSELLAPSSVTVVRTTIRTSLQSPSRSPPSIGSANLVTFSSLLVAFMMVLVAFTM